MSTPVTDEVEATIAHELSPVDRCDSCGSQAYIRATLPTGGQLLFCGHHGRKNKEKLIAMGATWHDESDRLTLV